MYEGAKSRASAVIDSETMQKIKRSTVDPIEEAAQAIKEKTVSLAENIGGWGEN